MKSKELILKCKDNCSCLSIDKWDDDDYIITMYNSYNKCGIVRRIKEIFKILSGGDVYNSEIVLSKKDFNKIKNF